MKKKIFSSLLLVAFALASTSMFVSCKDYDDDINKNADDIAALKTTIESLKTELANTYLKIQDAQAQYAVKSTETTAANAQSTAKDAQDRVDALEKWIAELSKAKSLQAVLDDLEATVLKAVEDKNYLTANSDVIVDLTNKVNAVDEKIATALADYVTKAGLKAELDPVKSAIENLTKQGGVIDQIQSVLEGKQDKLDGVAIANINSLVGLDIATLKEVQAKLKSTISTLETYPSNLGSLTNDDITAIKKLIEDAKQETDKDHPAADIIQFWCKNRPASIVFKPQFYLNGIETIEVPVLAYQAVISKTGAKKSEKFLYVGANVQYDSAQPTVSLDPADYANYSLSEFSKDPYGYANPIWQAFKKAANGRNYTFADPAGLYGEAQYHINPSTADIEGLNLGLVDNQALAIESVESKALANSARYILKDVKGKKEMVRNGILTVNVGFKNFAAVEAYAEQILKNAAYDEFTSGDITVGKYQSKIDEVALQIDNDTAVVSDYAAICPVLYHINAIADVEIIPTYKSTETAAQAQLAANLGHCANRDKATLHNNTVAHLFMTAADAINDQPTHMVYYQEQFDVRKWIRTHYAYVAPQSTGKDDINDREGEGNTASIAHDDALLAKLGLHYEYFLVPYAEGQNVTEETNHLEQIGDAKSSIFQPRSVDRATGETIKGQVADRYAIDREPLIRVELKNEAGQILEAGYIKVIISEKPVATDPVQPITVENIFDKTQKVDCPTSVANEMTWYQIENIVFAAKDEDGNYLLRPNGKDGMTKAEFDEGYEADVNSNGEFYRYTGANTTIDTRALGKITLKIDALEKETSVVKWEITDAQSIINKLGVVNNDDNTLKLNEKADVTYIRFVPKDEYKNVYPVVYLKLTIPEKKLQFAIATVKNKTLSYWYELNSNTNAISSDLTTANETHMNVPTPKAGASVVLTTDDFKKDLYEFFYNPTGAIAHDILAWKSTNPTFTMSKHGTFKLVRPNANNSRVLYANNWTVKGYSGRAYVLNVTAVTTNTDATTVQYITATYNGVRQNIVSLNYTPDDASTTTVNEETAVLKLEKSEFGYDIMNKVGHKELTEEDETFTAFLEIVNDEACYSFIEDPYFNVRFLRPINWYPSQPNDLKDALNAAQRINLSSFVKFNDWRTTDNTLSTPSTNYTGNSYPVVNISGITDVVSGVERTAYKYYGVEITSNDAECVTDLHHGKDDRAQITGDANIQAAINAGKLLKTKTFSGFKFTFDGVATYTYENNEGNLGTFNIYVPIYIKYTFAPWATDALIIKTWSSVKVVETVNNPATAKQN